MGNKMAKTIILENNNETREMIGGLCSKLSKVPFEKWDSTEKTKNIRNQIQKYLKKHLI